MSSFSTQASDCHDHDSNKTVIVSLPTFCHRPLQRYHQPLEVPFNLGTWVCKIQIWKNWQVRFIWVIKTVKYRVGSTIFQLSWKANYNMSMSLEVWAPFFSSPGNGEPLELKLSQDFQWNSKSQQELWQSASMASCLQSDTKPGTWESRTVRLPDSWFVSILGLQGQNTPRFQTAHSMFLAPQVPNNLQQVAEVPMLLRSQKLTRWMVRPKQRRLSGSLEANMISYLATLACAFITSSYLIVILIFMQQIPPWTLSLPTFWF